MISDLNTLPYLLTVGEAAELLRTTKKGIYAMHHLGKLPGAIRRGPRLLIIRDHLVKWIRESCASSWVPGFFRPFRTDGERFGRAVVGRARSPPILSRYLSLDEAIDAVEGGSDDKSD